MSRYRHTIRGIYDELKSCYCDDSCEEYGDCCDDCYEEEKRKKMTIPVSKTKPDTFIEKTFSSLKSKHSKQKKDSIFIIGSGPSLNTCNMGSLKKYNTFSMNRQYISYEKWGFFPTYYGCIDRLLVKTIANDIGRMVDNNMKSRPFPIKNFFLPSDHAKQNWEASQVDAGVILMATYAALIPDKELEKLKTYVKGRGRIRKNDLYKLATKINKPRSSFDNSEAPASLRNRGHISILGESWSNCGIFCTNIAAALGYKNIYLLGMDIIYHGDETKDHYDVKYFDTDHFTINSTHGRITAEGDTIRDWNLLKSLVSSPCYYKDSPNIISCTPNSPINEVFPYQSLDKVTHDLQK